MVFNANERGYRFVLLFFNCMLTFGSYFCFDMPSVLQTIFTGTRSNCSVPSTNGSLTNTTQIPSTNCTPCDDCLEMSDDNYNLLYAIYAWTNAVVVIGAGFLIDKLGNRFGAFLFSFLCVLGSSTFAAGAMLHVGAFLFSFLCVLGSSTFAAGAMLHVGAFLFSFLCVLGSSTFAAGAMLHVGAFLFSFLCVLGSSTFAAGAMLHVGAFLFSFLCVLGSSTFAAGAMLHGTKYMLPVILFGIGSGLSYKVTHFYALRFTVGAFLFSFLCVLGSSTFAAGAMLHGTKYMLPVMLLGRLLFGLGSSTLCYALQDKGFGKQCGNEEIAFGAFLFSFLCVLGSSTFAAGAMLHVGAFLFSFLCVLGSSTFAAGAMLHVGAFLFSFLCVLGSSTFAAGAMLHGTKYMLPVMLLGRLLFGSGNGSLTIVQNRITAYWFKNKELALAFGITLAFSRLGSVLNFFLTESFEACFGLNWTLWGGAMLCGIGFISAITVSSLDVYGVRQLGDSDNLRTESKKVRVTDVRYFSVSYWLLALSIMFFYNGVFPFVADSSKYIQVKYHYDEHDKTPAYISGAVYDVSMVLSPFLGGLIDIIGKRGILAMGCALFTIPVFGLLAFTHVYPLVPTLWLGITYSVAAVSLLFRVHYQDIIGKRGILAMGCALFTIPVFGLLAFTHVYPLVPTLWLGITYSVAAASLWPSIPLVVSQATIGTAMGLTTSIQMIGIGLSNLVVGSILGKDTGVADDVRLKRWKLVMIFLLGNTIMCVVTTLLLNLVDKKKGGILNLSRKQKLQAQQLLTDSGKGGPDSESSDDEREPLIGQRRQAIN